MHRLIKGLIIGVISAGVPAGLTAASASAAISVPVTSAAVQATVVSPSLTAVPPGDTPCIAESCDNQDPPTTYNQNTKAICASNPVDVPLNKVYNVANGVLEMRWSTACDMNWARFTPSFTDQQITDEIWIQTENGAERSSVYGFVSQAGVHFYSNGLYAPDKASACVEETYNHQLVESYCTPAI